MNGKFPLCGSHTVVLLSFLSKAQPLGELSFFAVSS